MKEYKQRIEEVNNLFKMYQEYKERSNELPYDECDRILSLIEESKKLRSKAVNKLKKLASDCGFNIQKDLKYDHKFQEVACSIETRINAAVAALYDFDQRYNKNISIA